LEPPPQTSSSFSTKMNSTTLAFSQAIPEYWAQFDQISASHVSLNYFEKLWAAWYAFMDNDVLATGIMSFTMHETVYFGRSLPFIIMDCLPSIFGKYKIQQTKIPSPWEQWQCALLVFLSHITVELPQIWFFHPICHFFGMQTTVPFPPLWKMIFQILVFFVVEDGWHYWNHRLMHEWTWFYKNVHKIHHQYSAPFGLAAEYASPIEVMVLGFGTVGVPVVWCVLTHDLHILTMYSWIVLRLFQAIDAHSGYEFPWSLHNWLPFWGGADFHDVHHEKFIGNYSSSFRWWDWMMHTTSGTPEFKANRARRAAEKAKKNL